MNIGNDGYAHGIRIIWNHPQVECLLFTQPGTSN
jgi:hypothetical protein